MKAPVRATSALFCKGGLGGVPSRGMGAGESMPLPIHHGKELPGGRGIYTPTRTWDLRGKWFLEAGRQSTNREIWVLLLGGRACPRSMTLKVCGQPGDSASDTLWGRLEASRRSALFWTSLPPALCMGSFFSLR